MKKRLMILIFSMGSALAFLPASSLSAQWKVPLQKNIYENGLTAVTQKDEASSVTVIEVLIKGGHRSEPAGKEGLSYLTTRLSLEIPDEYEVRELMEKSSRYMMTNKGDALVIHIECLTEYLENTLSVFARNLKDPLFSGIRIDRIKDFMNHERKIERDDPINVGHLTQLRTFLGNLGYSGSIYGKEETLKKIKGKDIEAFYKSFFTAGNMTLIALSDLDGEKLAAILKKYFGSFPSGKSPEEHFSSASVENLIGQKETVLDKDAKQAFVSLGFALPKISPRNYALAVLLETLLGKGPGSKLWTLRLDEKLAYNVSARATLMKEGGILEAYLETDVLKKEAARAALIKTVGELYAKGISADELRENKILAKSNFLRANETKDKRTGTLGQFEALGLGFDYITKFSSEVDAVILEEINGFLKEVLNPEKSALVIVGPKK